MFGVIFKPAKAANTFQAPSERSTRYVAIKRLSKRAIETYLQTGGEENPYKEIARMQELGDDMHVLSCTEALEDDEYLYIVTSMGIHGTLKDSILWSQPQTMDPTQVRDCFIQILNILDYLEKHGICHRDLSPDNFLFLTPTRLVAFDFALSLKVPVDENGQRTLMSPQGSFGTSAWMAPEVFFNLIYDSVGSDLWSAVIVLYNLVTNQVLYRLPLASDISFRYFILAEGLASNPLNERTIEILQTTVDEGRRDQQNALLKQASAHLNMDPSVMEIFEHVLRVKPHNRWTLAQVMESDYIQSDDR